MKSEVIGTAFDTLFRFRRQDFNSLVYSALPNQGIYKPVKRLRALTVSSSCAEPYLSLRKVSGIKFQTSEMVSACRFTEQCTFSIPPASLFLVLSLSCHIPQFMRAKWGSLFKRFAIKLL